MSVWTARSHEANFDSHPVSSVGEAEPAPARANSQRHEQSFDHAICNVSSGGSGDNHHSVVSEHDRSLNPAVATPPLRRTRGLPIIGLAGFILGVASTAILTNVPRFDFQPWTRWALGETFKLASSLAHPWPGTQENPAIPRLIAQPSQGIIGEPVPLGLEVQGPTEGAVVIIKGLLPGMDLSTGDPLNSDGWRIPVTDLAHAWVAPPNSFLGSAELAAELHLANDKIVARQVLHFEWRSATSPVSAKEISPPGQQDMVAASHSSPPLGRPAPHEQAVQVPFDPSEPAQLHRNRQTLTTAGGNGTSRASEDVASTAAVSNEMLQASPPVNARKPERTRDHRRVAAPANPRDGQADIRVTSPVTKTFPPKKNDTRHAASESTPVLKGFWDWSR
jgi:hypothetical protein